MRKAVQLIVCQHRFSYHWILLFRFNIVKANVLVPYDTIALGVILHNVALDLSSFLWCQVTSRYCVYYKMLNLSCCKFISTPVKLLSGEYHNTFDKSTLVIAVAWCCHATSHYLNQCWPRSISPYGVTRPQWVNDNINTLYAELFCICKFSTQRVNVVQHKTLLSLSTPDHPKCFNISVFRWKIDKWNFNIIFGIW